MMRTIFFLSIILLHSLFCIAQNSDSIIYNSAYKLTWDDFKGKPNNRMSAAALTNTSYKTSFGFSQRDKEIKIDFTITCTFIKKGSWVKPDKKIDYLLNHEQRHFDIAECGAREIRKKVTEAKFTRENYRALIRKIISETERKYRDIEHDYDSETSHSRISEKQEKWNERIEEMLKEFDEYKMLQQ